MKIIKNSQLFIVSLILGIIFFVPVGFTKAENVNLINVNGEQANVNENQANVNENQAKINEKQNKINENQANVNENQRNKNQINGADHRSTVATFVQSLLNVADREQGGIGDQVRVIANEQNDIKDNVANEIDKIKNRSGLKTFFFGTNYKNIGQLRSEMVKTGNHIDQLNALLDQTTNAEDKINLQTQITALTQEQQKINDFVKANESKFSLLGWFVKLFN